MNRRTFFLIAVAGFILAGCKPTENNYKAAYDKAYDAARRHAEEQSFSSEGVKLESLDAPRIEIVDGDTLLVGSKRVRPFETADSLTGTGAFGIAIARYSMPTNARRHVTDLRKEYPQAFIAEDGDDNYYVMIRRIPSIPEAAEPIRIFRLSHPDYPYSGLSSRPLLLRF